MERRAFVGGLTTAGVAGLLPGRTATAQTTAEPAPLASPAVQEAVSLAQAVAPRPWEENAIARDIVARALGPRFPNLPRARYESLHRAVEPAIRSALPAGRDFTQFSKRRVDSLPATDPVRQELRQLTGDAFIQKVLHAAGVRSALAAGPPPNTCLVLSGGGAKGSFEVGFLAYLKKHWSKLNVTAVCGTSVGSVNAVPIAQWGAAGVDRLVDLWLALNEDGDMYEPHPTLDDAHDALRQLGMDTKNLMDLLDADGLAKLVKALGIDLADEAALAATGLGGMVFGPVVAGPFGIVFALAGLFGTAIAAGLTIERVKALGKALSTIFSCPGFNSFAPLARLIERNVDISQLGQPGRPKLRLAMVCLEDGDLYYFTETGSLLRGSADPSKATDAFWKGPLSVAKVRQAVIASSSPPIEFPAVPLQEDHGVSTRRATRNFVDGGVREVLPARAAVDLGCERMVGVMAGPLQMPAEDYDASPPPFFATTMRCVLTMLNEVTRSDAEYVRDPTQRVMTAPMTDVIDSFTVDPGLIRINIDYGHMRGFDATLGIAGKTLNLAEQLIAFMAEEEIVRLRKQIWALEHGVALPVPRTPRPGAPPIMVMVFNQGLLGSIRAKKLELLDWARMRFQACRSDLDSLPVAIAGAAGRALCIQDWWRTWERHKPGQVADTLAANSLWTRLRIGVTGPGNTIDVLEPPGSVPAAPNAPELAC